MNPRLTNKKLVKALMDEKGIDMISIAQSTIVVQVSKNFTPAKAEELCNLKVEKLILGGKDYKELSENPIKQVLRGFFK